MDYFATFWIINLFLEYFRTFFSTKDKKWPKISQNAVSNNMTEKLTKNIPVVYYDQRLYCHS
jgi:hypothetical protein